MPTIPFLDTIGSRIVSANPGRATLECPLVDHTRNYVGNMHGGVIAAVAEAAARSAFRNAFPKGRHRTLEMKLNYFRPILDTKSAGWNPANVPAAGKAKISAVATLLSSDTKVSVASVDLFDSTKALAAAAIVTMQR